MLVGIFRVALLFICQGTALLSLASDFVILSLSLLFVNNFFKVFSTFLFCRVCRSILSLDQNVCQTPCNLFKVVHRISAVDFHYSIVSKPCQLLFYFFILYLRAKKKKPNFQDSLFVIRLAPDTLTELTEKEGFEPSRRLPDLHP